MGIPTQKICGDFATLSITVVVWVRINKTIRDMCKTYI